VLVERAAQLRRGPAEFRKCPAQLPRQFRQLLRAENHQRHQEDDDQVRNAEETHAGVASFASYREACARVKRALVLCYTDFL
jgi:hypothetical protein